MRRKPGTPYKDRLLGWIPKDWVGLLFGANMGDKRHDKIGPAPDFLTKQNVERQPQKQNKFDTESSNHGHVRVSQATESTRKEALGKGSETPTTSVLGNRVFVRRKRRCIIPYWAHFSFSQHPSQSNCNRDSALTSTPFASSHIVRSLIRSLDCLREVRQSG